MPVCNICLGELNLKDETVHTTTCGHVFHLPCLARALKNSSNCPQCRRPSIKHFQLFFTNENDDDVAGAACSSSNDALSKQMSQISKKIDRISTTLNSSHRKLSNGNATGFKCDREVEMYRNLVHDLQRENEGLKEILEMEKVISTNTERELDQAKLEIRERNDMINALQLQNDTLYDENMIYTAARPRVQVGNLLDLP